MGSGKTTLARELAKRTGRYMLDTDLLIEASANMRVGEIFATLGESSFRQMELEVVDWLERSVSNSVIATGGGMPTVSSKLKNIGEVVYLELEFETIYKRLMVESERSKRPLASSYDELLSCFASRQEIYLQTAHRVCKADNKTVDELCRSILN